MNYWNLFLMATQAAFFVVNVSCVTRLFGSMKCIYGDNATFPKDSISGAIWAASGASFNLAALILLGFLVLLGVK